MATARVQRHLLRINQSTDLDSEVISHLKRLEAESNHRMQEWVRGALRNEFFRICGEGVAADGARGGEAAPPLAQAGHPGVLLRKQTKSVDATGVSGAFLSAPSSPPFSRMLRIPVPVSEEALDARLVAHMSALGAENPFRVQEFLGRAVQNEYRREMALLQRLGSEIEIKEVRGEG